ncbi:AtpZ/AtpI family protein [Chondromyces apiculatus]|uniref:ATP synthase protein I n=1 Tax=Chondromyces apiculatus DSM 436 TaxID=1192034 RepID=A0A017TBK3_9BACT|nr:AtpZ/AtpI family protein [Chondromyces apiculatus]EYF06663.1 ATP synthase protein I [Chondromyces apiculatus DSM 436]
MKQEWKSVGNFGTVGLEIVLSILLGLFIGRKLDGWLDTSPAMTLVWSAFGVAAAIRAILRSVREMRAETEREEREQGNPAPLYTRADEQPDKEDFREPPVATREVTPSGDALPESGRGRDRGAG